MATDETLLEKIADLERRVETLERVGAGPQGATGPTGETGATGATGATGP